MLIKRFLNIIISVRVKFITPYNIHYASVGSSVIVGIRYIHTARVKGRELTTKLITLGPPVTSRGGGGGVAVFDTLLYYAAATPVTAGTRHPITGVWVAGPAVAGARTRPRTNTHARLSLAERRPVPPRLSNGTTAAAAVIFTRPRRIYRTSISHTSLYSLLGPGHGQTIITATDSHAHPRAAAVAS